MICVHQLMTTEPFVIPAGTTVVDATQALLQRKLHGAVVTDEDGYVLGVVSMTDLARQLLAGRTGLTMRDVSTRPPVSVSPGEGIYEAVRRMVRTGVHRLAVIDDEGALVGVLSPMDVLRGIVNLEGAFRAVPCPPEDVTPR